MSPRIVVSIKQVPDPEHFDRISLDPRTGSITRTGVPLVTNPLDRHALEEALVIKEQHGGLVYAITMGPPQARKVIEDALAMGVDKGAILCDQSFAGADTLATACILSAGIRSLGDCDLILCGNDTVDGATGQVPAQLAEFLGVPHVTHVRKIDVLDEKSAAVERTIEGGYLKIEVRFPAVISVLKNINRYRLPTVMGIVEAAGKEIVELDASTCREFGVSNDEMGIKGSPTRVAEVIESTVKRKVYMIEGEPEDVARKLVRNLRERESI
jgi:electron transfer flavoprotein beta subunit